MQRAEVNRAARGDGGDLDGADLRVRYANTAVSQVWDVPGSVFAGEPHIT